MDSPTTGKYRRLIDAINPTDRQLEFLRAIERFDYVFYGGAAGGGKSYILRWWLVSFLIQLHRKRGLRNVQVGLFCEDYPSLFDRQISKIQFEFPPELGHLEMGATKNFRLNENLGGGVIALRNLDDPSKYLSAEFAGIAIDELTRNDKSVFDFLRLRLRWPGVDRPKFAGGSNPGGRGHAWVKQLWIDREFPAELKPLESQFSFVQAKASDNPHLAQSYYDTLLTLPKDMAAAYAKGSWDIFAGQFFDIWDEERMTGAALEGDLKPWNPRWISMDWGFEHPAAVYWHGIGDDRKTRTYRERVFRHTAPRDIANAVVNESEGEKIGDFYLSPDAFAKRTDEQPIADQIGDVLSKNQMVRPVAADDDRIGGWMLLYQMLNAGEWLIDKSCMELIKCLPTLVRDAPKRPEDVLKRDGDDPADSARYGLKSRHSPGTKPVGIRIQDRIVAHAEQLHTKVENMTPHTVATLSRRAALLERTKQRRPTFRPGRG